MEGNAQKTNRAPLYHDRRIGIGHVQNPSTQRDGLVMIERPFEPSVTFALDILLDQLDPHRDSRDTTTRADRQLCGQWLAFRRLQRQLSDQMIAQRTQLEPYQLRQLETGLAEPKLFPTQALHNLSLILEDQQHDFAWVRSVIDSAVGVAAAPVQTLERLSAELHTNLNEAALTLPQEEVSAAPVSIVSPPFERPEVYEILVSLLCGATTGLAIKRDIAKRSKGRSTIGLFTIHAVLAYLLKNHLAETHRPSTEMSADRQWIYQLLPEGEKTAHLVIEYQEAKRRSQEYREKAQQDMHVAEEHLHVAEEREEQLDNLMPLPLGNPLPA